MVLQTDDGVAVHRDGSIVFRCLDDRAKPVLADLAAPGGLVLTRGYPFRDGVAGEAHDHPHHAGLWFAHGDVNGVDFWHLIDAVQEGEGRVAIVEETSVDRVYANGVVLLRAYQWLDRSGALMAREKRWYRVVDRGSVRVLDVVVEVEASGDDLVFGDTKEGTFGVRVHPALRVRGEVATGRLVNSEGDVDVAVWGKQARWVHDSGEIGGVACGVVLMDHPENLRSPTWWHARLYGLLAANPFGRRSFGETDGSTGDFVLKAGKRQRFGYRVLLHRGSLGADAIEAFWRHMMDEIPADVSFDAEAIWDALEDEY